MGRLIDANFVYNAIQITTDNFGVAKHVVETNMLDMLAKIPTVDAIPKADYENRLKADMTAILTELQLEIQEFSGCSCTCSDGIVNDIDDLIQQKIDKLKGADNDSKRS